MGSRGWTTFKSSTKRNCLKCGAEMVFFLQHAHGNYPLLDYVCPKCQFGEENGAEAEVSNEGPGD